MAIAASGPRFALRALLLLFLPLVAACAEDPRAAVLLDETPEQPLAFMHSVHVDDNQIPCAYCHSSANASEEAGVPAVGTCMGCHRFVQGATPEYQTEIRKVLEFAADSTA